ncbi:MAG: hypothetical protein IM600_07160 [Bacteroidetes bacterium]|nr:hypothetical protein [Bacteroidota bacterium]MCA6443187.1 hypothetical protein [Bacteroidota bacterium]
MKHLLLIGTFFCLSCLILATTGCEKNTDCKATVKVVDSTGAISPNSDVFLYASVKNGTAGTTVVADVKANGTTDAGGEVKFTFKLPAIYDIRSTRVVGTRTLIASGIIKLEEGKNVDKTVTLK